MKKMNLIVGLAIVTLGACGGSSPTAPSAPVSEPIAATSAFTGERWQAGLKMHHCFGPDVDSGVAQAAADLLSVATGIEQTTAGPCNVTWSLGDATDGGILGDGAQAYCMRTYEGQAITSAHLTFASGNYVFHAGLHELGHTVGLGHSTSRDDIMFSPGSSNATVFSPAERALLTSMYR